VTDPSNTPRGAFSDYDVEQFIGRLLQAGVIIAAAVTIVGAILFVSQHGRTVPDLSTFRGEPAHLTSLGGIVGGVLALRGDAIAQLGIVLLIATPVARVAFTLVAFAFQRDRTYVAITLLVLFLLLYGLVYGKAG
jgi:uncharacterized membrane protein